mmetsp:Transcript_20195/g.43625  ORF Transcript_20195/g.43625 Transcript_20195/m.43625 type:complete len:101 (-) Transcript_20195:44-346(-)
MDAFLSNIIRTIQQSNDNKLPIQLVQYTSRNFVSNKVIRQKTDYGDIENRERSLHMVEIHSYGIFGKVEREKSKGYTCPWTGYKRARILLEIYRRLYITS